MDIEGLFQAGVRDITFDPSGWDALTFRSEIRTELFPKVYLNPSNLWIKEQEKLIGTMITAATFQALEGKKVNTIEENVEENIKYHEYDNGLLIKEYVVGQTIFYEVVSKVEYKEEAVKADKPKENKLLDSFQFVLDIAGLIPVVGEVADGVNGVIYSARGDALNATLSFSAMIPIAGWASTGGKLAKKGSDLYQSRNVLSTERVESIYSPFYQDVVNSPLGKTQNLLDILYNTHSQSGTPKALIFNLPSAKTEIPTTIKSGDAEVKTEIKNVDIEAKGTDNPRTRLPRNNGHWEGEPGNGKWYSDKPEVKNITNGEGVEFAKSRPNFTPWSEGNIVFENGKLTGTSDDFSLVYEKIQQQYNLPSKNAAKKLLKQAGVTPHHKSSTEIELIPTDLHGNVPHIGSASDLRGGY